MIIHIKKLYPANIKYINKLINCLALYQDRFFLFYSFLDFSFQTFVIVYKTIITQNKVIDIHNLILV